MTHRLPAPLLLGCLLLAGAVPSLAAAQTARNSDSTGTAQAFAGPSTATTADDADYTAGTRALDQQRWQDAITSFDRVITAHGKRAEAALYWKAYALNKLGRTGLVTATCSQLHTTYPRSSWNRDCSTLFATNPDPGIYAGGPAGDCVGCIRPTSPRTDEGIYRGNPQPRTPVDPDRIHAQQEQLHGTRSPFLNTPGGPGSDADLKMLALNSLLQREPAQALPAIRNILSGSNSSPQLKQRAVTALAMSQSPEAQALLRDIATGKTAPDQQREAVQMLGVFQGKRAGDTLAEIYRTSPDRNIKRAALNGLFVAADAQRLVDLARNEKDLQLKHDIVAELALMHDKVATDYMLELLR